MILLMAQVLTLVISDTYASDSASFQLIFGPNMSGKSTLLRQIALLHIMAQVRLRRTGGFSTIDCETALTVEPADRLLRPRPLRLLPPCFCAPHASLKR